MGITNFCVLIDCLQESWKTPQPFDAILYDVQSLLHVGITNALETQEDRLFQELCRWAWIKMEKVLNELLSLPCADTITLILSFDGEGVPMKWPTQRNRRMRKETHLPQKTKYRSALFGTNKIALAVQDYFKERIKQYKLLTIQRLKVVISGCNVPGEGEHKLFHIAEVYQCQKPIVVSEDQDVFVIALMRMDRYKSLQVYRYEKFYPVHKLMQTWAPYSPRQLEICSFLFGNDFIPPLVGITPSNASDIHHALSEGDDEETPPYIIAHFLERMESSLRFQTVTCIDPSLVDAFWVTFLWLKDYYTRHSFPQKYIENTLFDQFDRNALLSALSLPDYSKASFQRAQTLYNQTTTAPTKVDQAIASVFKYDGCLTLLKPYWVKPVDGLCTVIELKKIPSKASTSTHP